MRVRFLASMILLGTACATVSPAQAQSYDDYDDSEELVEAEGPEMEVEAFDQPLAPYGEWLYINGVGRVWRPYREVVGVDFRPYATGGNWEYTDAGWVFVSSYSWGWAPFHYGHWWFEPAFGWVWQPGSRWAPAWVEWRYGGGYVGWAPVPPPGFQFAFTASWGSPWCFVETRYISRPSVVTYVVPVTRVRTVYTVTHSAPSRSYGRTYYSPGPPRRHVQSVMATPVRAVPVRQVAHAVPPSTTVRTSPVRVESQRRDSWREDRGRLESSDRSPRAVAPAPVVRSEVRRRPPFEAGERRQQIQQAEPGRPSWPTREATVTPRAMPRAVERVESRPMAPVMRSQDTVRAQPRAVQPAPRAAPAQVRGGFGRRER